MCMSVDQMSTARLEEEITRMREWLQNPRYQSSWRYYEARIEGLEKVLKQRAEDGTMIDGGF